MCEYWDEEFHFCKLRYQADCFEHCPCYIERKEENKMTVYSLTETCGNAGCYGVFSTLEKATAKAMELIKSWDYDNAEETSFDETVYDGFHKCIYYGENESAGCFEIWKHELDE